MSARLLAAETAWLDLLLKRDLSALREAYALSEDEFRGLWVGDDLVDACLNARGDALAVLAQSCPDRGRLRLAGARFGLNDTERGLVMLALAADLDGKYESIFAYLNGLASRRWPTIGLACRLFGGPSVVLPLLAENGRLRRRGLIAPATNDPSRPESGVEFRAARALLHFVAEVAANLPAGSEWLAPAPGAPGRLAPFLSPEAEGVKLALLAGRGDCGRLDALRALAHAQNRPILRARFDFADPALDRHLGEFDLLARLHGALLALEGAEPSGPEALRIMTAAARRLDDLPAPVFALVEPESFLWQTSAHGSTARLVFADPKPRERERLWRAAIATEGLDVAMQAPRELAARFRLGPERIAEAAAAARLLAGAAEGADDKARLFAAARDLSGHELARLTRRVPHHHRLYDLVLPVETLERVKAVINAVAHRDLVHDEWGLAEQGRASGGLAALFQGPSGVGKTMTASVIAAEAGLDLFRIDLSSVVSKYIGETEKNLEVIFRAARQASAVLMFDEADAIFGKRAEVKDAHDRYANIEIAYLLQRIEEHDGPVILATNLAKNIDQAFSRRLNFIVEFPRPDAMGRERLWRRMLAPPLPAAPEVDCAALGREFELTGGDIRKAVLEAAYMAAGEGGLVDMRHLVAGAILEARRQGRMVAEQDLRLIQEVA